MPPPFRELNKTKYMLFASNILHICNLFTLICIYIQSICKLSLQIKIGDSTHQDKWFLYRKTESKLIILSKIPSIWLQHESEFSVITLPELKISCEIFNRLTVFCVKCDDIARSAEVPCTVKKIYEKKNNNNN